MPQDIDYYIRKNLYVFTEKYKEKGKTVVDN